MHPLVSKITFAVLTLSTSLTFAQTAKPTIPPCKTHFTRYLSQPATSPIPCRQTGHRSNTSLSLGAFPQLTATRIVSTPQNFNTVSSSPSAGVFGTFRQTFNPWLGYSINAGYTRASERSTDNAGFETPIPSNFTIPANVYEFSLAYVAEKQLNHRLSVFATVGAGVLAFLPDRSNNETIATAPYSALHASFDFRPLGVGGVGLDYLLSTHLTLRAEYRGQLYKFADYGHTIPRYLTITSEPTFSVVYNFTHPK